MINQNVSLNTLPVFLSTSVKGSVCESGTSNFSVQDRLSFNFLLAQFLKARCEWLGCSPFLGLSWACTQPCTCAQHSSGSLRISWGFSKFPVSRSCFNFYFYFFFGGGRAGLFFALIDITNLGRCNIVRRLPFFSVMPWWYCFLNLFF